jgi:alkylation response protein AidB-like acyl-CoA dehydrogenase
VIFNEEQSMLKDTARAFIEENAPVDNLRKLRAAPEGPAYDLELWQQLVELGIPAVALPEEYGGLGFGFMGLAAVLGETGRNLVATPLVSSVALAASLIKLVGTEEQKSRWLPALASGELTATVAVQEGRHYNPKSIETKWANGALSGSKTMVMDAQEAGLVLVIAKNASGALCVLALNSLEGVEQERYMLMDGRKFSDLHFRDLAGVEELGEGEQVASVEQALDIATIALAAEMIGGAESLLERTVYHLNEREQFDVKLATFQALQHRCAEMHCQLELARSAVLSAFTRLDQGRNIAKAASQAKALANECYQHISNEAVQMHGGMGITDELDIGLYLKRSRVCNQLFGDANFHRKRYALQIGI